MQRVDIKIGFDCNNQCQFCVQGDKRYKHNNRTLSEIKESLKLAKEQGSQGVVFTGGEPTIHPDILNSVAYAKDLGFAVIQIQSNGRMFAYLDFCKKLINAGANEFSPALHASSPEIHDKLTSSKGSWQQVVQGIKNLKSLNQYVLTNTVINSLNYKDLPDLAKFFIDLDVDQYQFAFVHILGTANKNKDWIVPKKSDVMPYVIKGLDIGIKAGKTVMTEAIPYCLMQGYDDFIAEKIMPETMVVDAEGIIESYTDYRWHEGKRKREECKQCKYFKICEGPWKEYPDIYGWDEFVPINMITQDFIKIKNYDNDLVKQLEDMYGFKDLLSVYKYKGHSCQNVHLFIFENNKVILKFLKNNMHNIGLINKELNWLDDLSAYVNFPKLYKSKKSLPYLEFADQLIKVYEFIDGDKEINLNNNIDAISKFVQYALNKQRQLEKEKLFNKNKIYKEVNEYIKSVKVLAQKNKRFTVLPKVLNENRDLLDEYFNEKEQVIIYQKLNLLNRNGQVFFLESENLAEKFYPLTFVLAKYLIKIIICEKKLLDPNPIINNLADKINYNLNNKRLKLIKILLLLELVNKFCTATNFNEVTQDKYLNYYDSLLNNILVGYGKK